MNKPNLGLSITIGVLFSIFITSIYILMSTVPALVGHSPEPTNPVADAIVVFFVVAGFFSFAMHEWQKVLEDFNKRGREKHEERTRKENEKDTGDSDPK